MNKEIIDKWELYKNDLKDYFKNNEIKEYYGYGIIVSKIIELIINKNIDYGEYNYENILRIDDGSYQGTEIYITHRNFSQPSVEDYIYTSVYYGSCSGCDTLQAICDYSAGKPNESQLNDFMTLALHLIQKMKVMGGEE